MQAAIELARREGADAQASLLKRRPGTAGGGYFRQRSDAEIAEDQRRVELERAKSRLIDARRGRNLPPGYASANLEDLTHLPLDSFDSYSRAVDRMQKILDWHGIAPLIVGLTGTIGSGKTYLACALINAMTEKGRTARYTTAFDYILAVRRTYSSEKDQTDVENEHIKPELLVLDEMQVRGETPNEELLLFRLIDKRYQHRRATLLLSNHETQQAFQERIDARIADRMNEGGGIILADWKSLRGRLQ